MIYIYDFSKSGKYEIYFDGQKIKEIYAHRKPASDFDISISGSKLTLASKSYDLNSNDNIGYGADVSLENVIIKKLQQQIGQVESSPLLLRTKYIS